jgi:hypothetical protein
MPSVWIGRLRRAAVGGVVAWGLASGAGLFLDRGIQLVALAPVVILPLGLALVPAGEEAPTAYGLASGAVLVAGPCALLAALLAPGPAAAALAAPWLAATLLVGLVGALRLRARGLWPIRELALDAGMLYLPVGGVWLLASRAGVALLGFREPIVTFTAAHFHYAGFAAPVIAGLLGRALGEGAADRFYRGVAGVVILGIPLVAAGIQFSRLLEFPAAIFLSLGMLGAAALLARTGLRLALAGPTVARFAGSLRILGGAALVFSMLLAALFAATGSATRESSEPLIPYTQMAELHGVANALGFSLLVLLSFTLVPPCSEGDSSHP